MDDFISITIHNRFNFFPFHSDGDNSNPVVVVGPGRSGNTLFKRELSTDYEIFFPPELPNLGQTIRAFARVRRRSWGYVVKATLDTFRKSADITIKLDGQKDYNLNTELNIDWNNLERELKYVQQNDRNLAHILFAIMSHHYKARMGSDAVLLRWGDKTPWNLFHLPNLQRTFPDATYVFMVRKPVAVVSSYVKAFRENKGMSVEDATFRWISAVKLILKGKSFMPRSIILKYEDFVEEPKKHLMAVAELAALSRRNAPGGALSVASDLQLLHHSNLSKPVFAAKESDIPRYLTQKEIDFIKMKTETVFERLSYE